MEIAVRITCPKCKGTGRERTETEATEAAREHNAAAAQCNMKPNFLPSHYFLACTACNGVGKVEQWMEIGEGHVGTLLSG